MAVALLGACASSGPSDVVAGSPPGSAGPTTTAPATPTTTTVEVTVPGATDAPTTSTAAPSTSVPPAVSVPASAPTSAPSSASLTAQLFWVRAPGDARVIDIPGYRDPDSGPLPLVVYGSVTNDGRDAVSEPVATATWLDSSGTAVESFSAAVVAPGTTTALTTLEAGQSGDVIIVVTDPATADRLADLTPELGARGR